MPSTSTPGLCATPSQGQLALAEGEFTVRDDTNNIFTATWQWEPTKPTRNAAGVTGWALCGDKVKRLHVCANNPCSARYPPSKYGLYGPPTHVRLIEPAPVATTTTTTVALPALAAASEVASCGANDMPPPVVVTPTAASPEPWPGTAAPEAPAVAGTKAASEEVRALMSLRRAPLLSSTR